MRRTDLGSHWVGQTETTTQQPEQRDGTGEMEIEESRSFVGIRKGEAKSSKSLDNLSEIKDNYFLLKASTFSVWSPSVIGDITQFPKLFLTSAITSLAAKVVTLTTAAVLAVVGFQEKIQPNHFIVLCRDINRLEQSNNETNIVFCTSWEDCFNPTVNLQKK